MRLGDIQLHSRRHDRLRHSIDDSTWSRACSARSATSATSRASSGAIATMARAPEAGRPPHRRAVADTGRVDRGSAAPARGRRARPEDRAHDDLGSRGPARHHELRVPGGHARPGSRPSRSGTKRGCSPTRSTGPRSPAAGLSVEHDAVGLIGRGLYVAQPRQTAPRRYSMTSALAQLAEDPEFYVDPPEGAERILDDRYCIVVGSERRWAGVCRPAIRGRADRGRRGDRRDPRAGRRHRAHRVERRFDG